MTEPTKRQDEVAEMRNPDGPDHCPACMQGQDLSKGEGTHLEGTVEHPEVREDVESEDQKIVLERWPWAVETTHGIYLVSVNGAFLGKNWKQARGHKTVALHEISRMDETLHILSESSDLLVAHAAENIHSAIHKIAGLLSPEPEIRAATELEVKHVR